MDNMRTHHVKEVQTLLQGADMKLWYLPAYSPNLNLEQFPEIMRKRKRGQGAQGKAEDAGGLMPVKDNNAALRFLGR